MNKKNSVPKTEKIFKIRKPEFKKFSLPESFLKQLQEFSGGSFVLLLKDEKGDIGTYTAYDSSSDFLSMATFGINFFGAQAEVAGGMIANIAIQNSKVIDGEDFVEED